jgi:hypothetical protein
MRSDFDALLFRQSRMVFLRMSGQITVPAALSPLNRAEGIASRTETMFRCGGQPIAEWPFDLDFARSRESRRRHRVLISAQHLAAFFDCRDDHS